MHAAVLMGRLFTLVIIMFRYRPLYPREFRDYGLRKVYILYFDVCPTLIFHQSCYKFGMAGKNEKVSVWWELELGKKSSLNPDISCKSKFITLRYLEFACRPCSVQQQKVRIEKKTQTLLLVC
jgi:hypothetical protein